VIGDDSITANAAWTRLRREFAFLKKTDHSFIAEFFQVVETNNAYCLAIHLTT
jgi:hypothetical protein